MKVTDAMVHRFGLVCAAHDLQATPEGGLADILRAALEAALADEPEPGDIVAACDKACRYSEGLAQAAEAKLARVRAWRRNPPDWRALDAMLGEEP